ncbi:hypothetical protein GCK72_007230 [Caenorhabditis remanei]|uniref:Uncharacterized protein n=1 Tax=Caenorhabditis remanei TaxID=31234 RepID=A0A6A5HJD9_CAERE|nr:hypothetical protein GCK72_007230 [Caenorhabditis remanei]KAF1767271.1 hypothetical protein GCK72_007230 [Caenorhabditis remanei]
MRIDLLNFLPSSLCNQWSPWKARASGSSGDTMTSGGVWDSSDRRVYQGTCEERKLRSLYPKPFGDPLGLEKILSEGTANGSSMKTPSGQAKEFAGKGMDGGQSFLNSAGENHHDEIEVQLQEYLDSCMELEVPDDANLGPHDGYRTEIDIYSSEYLFEESMGMTDGFFKTREDVGMESVGPYPKFIKTSNMSFYERKIGSLYPKPYGDPLGLQDLLREIDEEGDGTMRQEKAKSDGRQFPVKGSSTSVTLHVPMSRKRNYGFSCSRSAQIHWKGFERLDDYQENKKDKQWPRKRRASKARKPTTGRVPKRKSPKT